jgi:exodeoxyribonuclease VII small subunit
MPAADAVNPGGNDDIATMTFDKALDELRTVVTRLEQGGMPLEESIALYERGAALHEHCGTLLDSAELRVQRLVDGAGGGAPRVMDLRPDDGEEL